METNIAQDRLRIRVRLYLKRGRIMLSASRETHQEHFMYSNRDEYGVSNDYEANLSFQSN